MKGDEPKIAMIEKWRDVPGYEGFYQISIDTQEGKCRSFNYYGFGKGGILLNEPHKNRIYWGLSKNGKYERQQAARWIAITYPELIENEYFEGAEIDHKDSNSMNNNPSNLRWVNHLENMQNPNTRKKLKGGSGRNPIPVVQINKENGELVKKYESAAEAAATTGIPAETIRGYCTFRIKQRGEYFWRYDKYNRY